MSMFSLPRYSNWRIAGSAGVDVQVETPVVNVSVGASYLQLPLKNIETKEQITLHMGGVAGGVGVGVSAFGIVDIEGSLSAFPSDGIGRIVTNFNQSGRIKKSDFTGNRVLALSVGGKAGAGASLMALAFIKPSFWNMVATAAVPGPADDLIWSHCGGVFYGTSVGAGASVGVTAYQYQVLFTR